MRDTCHAHDIINIENEKVISKMIDFTRNAVYNVINISITFHENRERRKNK